ncbi:beta-ketoacyl synthase N-terminal-like domain-containing protein [Paenibacillus larvae]|nr:beta-ketoacyl synthase N-terminal-like domain-containing protein [Paenibacillus larvae]MDT2304836.1 beta-ketoacyl synthase N-terminal-like domain-containing protein [Paenibacillus larvae]
MNTNKQRIVVTGMGIICPNGKNLDEFWERGKSRKVRH